MAAYGALVSVMNIIDTLQKHPSPPISIDQKQVESLTHVVTSLQDFLEGYSSQGCLLTSRGDHLFSTGMQQVIENMNLIKIEIKETRVDQDQRHIGKSVSTAAGASSSRSTSTAQNVPMIGFDDVLLQMLNKITGGDPDLQIIPIVGMGGIGKTTLARNIYVSPLVQESFGVRAWSVISQDYNAREILRKVLDQVDKEEKEKEEKKKKDRKHLSEDELGEHLYKYLIGRKYFIVMDDMWETYQLFTQLSCSNVVNLWWIQLK